MCVWNLYLWICLCLIVCGDYLLSRSNDQISIKRNENTIWVTGKLQAHYNFLSFSVMTLSICLSSVLCNYQCCKFLIHFTSLPNSFAIAASSFLRLLCCMPPSLWSPCPPKRSCKSNFLKFLLTIYTYIHPRTPTDRQTGRQTDREKYVRRTNK